MTDKKNQEPPPPPKSKRKEGSTFRYRHAFRGAKDLRKDLRIERGSQMPAVTATAPEAKPPKSDPQPSKGSADGGGKSG